MSQTIYETQVIGKGDNVEAFGTEMLILFGNEAPDTLKDFCYSIKVEKPKQKIEPGQTLMLGDYAFKIAYVGDIAERNLTNLGHLTVNFNGKEESLMPGAIVVEAKPNPGMAVGTTIKIVA